MNWFGFELGTGSSPAHSLHSAEVDTVVNDENYLPHRELSRMRRGRTDG